MTSAVDAASIFTRARRGTAAPSCCSHQNTGRICLPTTPDDDRRGDSAATEEKTIGRKERRIFRINDEIHRLERELAQARAELDVHRHLAGDAERDAAVYDSPLDRDDARETAADVARFRSLVIALEARIETLAAKRDRLVARLD